MLGTAYTKAVVCGLCSAESCVPESSGAYGQNRVLGDKEWGARDWGGGSGVKSTERSSRGLRYD